MTYTDSRVAQALNDNFITARINSSEQTNLARRFHVHWTPTLVAMHYRNIPIRETIGFLPPVEMLAELLLMQGLYELRTARPEKAKEVLGKLLAGLPRASVAPEAMFWQGVVAYRRTRNKDDLWEVWRRLAADHPDSVWAAKTTLLPEEEDIYR